ncbi:hypothetical protein ACFVU3_06620 [Streptomyces sp. NPDC058052]|uniref:hypothetical protein n=1 Tax=Streptomyces sp. NPDC058052 TaxID=3346316 RepID=UPI0036ECC619
MTNESSTAAGDETLRRAELERREVYRRARESGFIPQLRARRRPVVPDRTADVAAPAGDTTTVRPSRAVDPLTRRQPLQLSARVTDVLQRISVEAGIDPGFIGTAAVGSGTAVEAELRLRVLNALEALEALPALRHLAELTTAGVSFLTPDELDRADALGTDRLPAPDTEPECIDRWQVHLEAREARGKAVLSTAAWQRLAEALPLPVLDDLLDRGVLTRREAPHSWIPRTDRVRHIIARVEPEELADAELLALQWEGEARRRTLWAGGRLEPGPTGHDEWSLRSALARGDASVLDELAPRNPPLLPRDLVRLVDGLRTLRRGGAVDAWLGRERSLFGLMEQCLPPGRSISGRTAFHAWAGVRLMYRLLDEAHQSLACDPDRASETLRNVADQAAALRSDTGHGAAVRADREARAVQAYLHFLSARPGERDRLDRAVGLLEDVLHRGRSSPGGVSGDTRSRLRSSSMLLQTLRQRERPHDVLNPYLALGVSHGSSAWRQGWRDLRRGVTPGQLEYINGAKDRIQRHETARRSGQPAEELYRLPLDDRFTQVPQERGDLLRPPARPMERRSAPGTEEEWSWTAAEAAREIIERCAMRMRNDH